MSANAVEPIGGQELSEELPRLSSASRNSNWLLLAAIGCIGFGIALIANVQQEGDGMWYWYAAFLRNGTHLYSDLKIPLQPLMVLETEFFLALLGKSWLASKVPAVLNLLLYVLAMYLIASKARWPGQEKAIIIAAAFFVGIGFEGYRFDDYHVVASSLILYCTLLLLSLRKGETMLWRQYAIVAGLGLLIGLMFTTRVAEGVVLFLISVVAIPVLSSARKRLSLFIMSLAFAATVAAIVAMTGDTLGAWASSTIFGAASIKGGGSAFISDPCRMIWSAITFVFQRGLNCVYGAAAISVSLAVSFELFAKFRARTTRSHNAYFRNLIKYEYLGADGNSNKDVQSDPVRPEASSYGRFLEYCATMVLLIVAAAIVFWSFRVLFKQFINGDFNIALSAVLIVACCACALYVFVKLAVSRFKPYKWATVEPYEVLLLVPLAMLGIGSLSTGGVFFGLYEPIGFFILLFPLISPIKLTGFVRSLFLGLLIAMAACGILRKIEDPASWINFATPPLFMDRSIINHPTYGPMVIDNRQLGFIDRICTIVHDGDSRSQFLSLPFSYANYYCAIPPWHNYVQTWFDTTSKGVIQGLQRALETSPPTWILYQRQPASLAIHESIFNGGHPLQQRYLDDMIMARIASGAWRVVRRDTYSADNDWILIRTRWITSKKHGASMEQNFAASAGWKAWSASPKWSAIRGTFSVQNQTGAALETILTHDVKFRTEGGITVLATIGASNLPPATGYGYAIDLYDATTDKVVGSLGFSTSDEPARPYGFTALVSPRDKYLLRLRYQAAGGRASFSNIRIHSGTT